MVECVCARAGRMALFWRRYAGVPSPAFSTRPFRNGIRSDQEVPSRMEEQPPPVLLDMLPDTVLQHTCDFLSPNDLGALCQAAASFNRYLTSPEANEIWLAFCKKSPGMQIPADGRINDAKARFSRFVTTLCFECRQPTKYIYSLLGRRLCESCEAKSPQIYALASIEQLVHEKSAVGLLSPAQRKRLFASPNRVGGSSNSSSSSGSSSSSSIEALPSLSVAGHRWYRRQQAVAAAEAALRSHLNSDSVASAPDVSDVAADADAGLDAAAGAAATGVSHERSSCLEEEGEEEEEEEEEEAGSSRADAVASQWEQAAAEHSARRRAGAAERALERESKKAHKKKVKAEQRSKRNATTLAVMPSAYTGRDGRRLPGSAHKPKRATHSDHRAAPEPNAWESQLEKLEEVLGVNLCGLSGLVLADDA